MNRQETMKLALIQFLCVFIRFPVVVRFQADDEYHGKIHTFALMKPTDTHRTQRMIAELIGIV